MKPRRDLCPRASAGLARAFAGTLATPRPPPSPRELERECRTAAGLVQAVGRSLELGKNGHTTGDLLDLSAALALASQAERLILAEAAAALGRHARLTPEQAQTAADRERAGLRAALARDRQAAGACARTCPAGTWTRARGLWSPPG
ncbi:MAG: hypothetical protein HY814_13655 [Candidatus Riflebacteria bacterium]|nr:hypothetical protein [Candidatus Riflebacteria bacterium]